MYPAKLEMCLMQSFSVVVYFCRALCECVPHLPACLPACLHGYQFIGIYQTTFFIIALYLVLNSNPIVFHNNFFIDAFISKSNEPFQRKRNRTQQLFTQQERDREKRAYLVSKVTQPYTVTVRMDGCTKIAIP